MWGKTNPVGILLIYAKHYDILKYKFFNWEQLWLIIKIKIFVKNNNNSYWYCTAQSQKKVSHKGFDWNDLRMGK